MEIAGSLAFGRSPDRDWRQVLLAGCALGGLAAVAAAAAIAAQGTAGNPVPVAIARALTVGIPIAVGLYTCYRHPGERFGPLLVVAGAAWFLTTLAESGDELVYTVGRTAGWLVEILLVYLLLSFPTGRVAERTDRLLVGAMGLIVLTTFLPRLVLAEDFDVPSPYTSCTGDCPANAFFSLGHEPAIVDAVMRPLGTLLVVAVMVAVLLRMGGRIGAATPFARRMIIPVLAIGAVRAGLIGAGLVARDADSTAWHVEVAAWLIALAVPAIALVFLLGLLRRRLFAGRALERLAEDLRAVPSAATLRLALAKALGDPSIEIAFPARDGNGGWIDSSGCPIALPEPAGGRGVSELREGGAVAAAVIHDDALRADPRLLDAALMMAGVALDNQRLAAEAEAATREIRRSRARIAASAARERRRIERDLHDGAQQRLVALRIELGLARDLVRRDLDLGLERLEELEGQLEGALEELRSLAHGVYPPLLADRGLVEALQAAAAPSTIPVEVDAHEVGRYSPEVESAVYFCVLEAVQNALKHASGARRIVVRLDGGDGAELRFSVRDDGAGSGDGTVDAGAGITNMHDRLAAFGGDVRVSSRRGVGTTVNGHVRLSAPTGV